MNQAQMDAAIAQYLQTIAELSGRCANLAAMCVVKDAALKQKDEEIEKLKAPPKDDQPKE